MDVSADGSAAVPVDISADVSADDSAYVSTAVSAAVSTNLFVVVVVVVVDSRPIVGRQCTDISADVSHAPAAFPCYLIEGATSYILLFSRAR